MKKLIWIIIVVIVMGGGVWYFTNSQSGDPELPTVAPYTGDLDNDEEIVERADLNVGSGQVQKTTAIDPADIKDLEPSTDPLAKEPLTGPLVALCVEYPPGTENNDQAFSAGGLDPEEALEILALDHVSKFKVISDLNSSDTKFFVLWGSIFVVKDIADGSLSEEDTLFALTPENRGEFEDTDKLSLNTRSGWEVYSDSPNSSHFVIDTLGESFNFRVSADSKYPGTREAALKFIESAEIVLSCPTLNPGFLSGE
jgi:hypothetical protein